MRRFLIILLTVLLTSNMWSQVMRRLTVEDGLPSNTVRHIVQDRRGFMWFGTDNGLCRFDGTQVRAFRIPENGIDQFVMSLKAEGDSLLVGTQRGIFSFSFTTETFRLLEGQESQPTGRGDRLQTQDGTLWVGTWEEGLMQIGASGLPEQKLNPTREGLGHHIHQLFEYDQRILLMGCDEGLLAYDRKTGTASLWETPKFVYAIERDNEGGLWVGTFYDGVCYLNNMAHRFETVGGHVISRFCEDRNGQLWIASDDNGLSCIGKDGKTINFTGHDMLSRENVHALCAEHRADADRLWVGTYTGGVYRLASNGIRRYTTDDGLYDNSSYAICQDKQGQLWVASMTGLCRYDERADRFIAVKELDGVTVSMATDAAGRLWVATQGGGLYRFDGKTWKQYQHRNDTTSLSDNELNSVVMARDGRLWVATQNGLCLYRPKTDDFLRVMSGTVSSIVEDDKGDGLWLGTEEGVVKFSSPNTKQRIIFTREDGLVSTQFCPDACFRDSHGYIYFGTTSGYSRVLTSHIRTNHQPPRVYITGLEVFNRTIHVGDELMKEALSDSGQLSLSYSDRMFSLQYAALSYVSPSKNQYAYRLDGFDSDWNYVGAQTKATYTNLPPGTYTFRVKATNNDGLWSTDEARLTIVVSPPFWWSWPARIVYLLLIIGAIWYYMRLRLRRAERRHQEDIQRLSEAKEREAREARMNFFTMIAHEIRTPVTLIIGPLEELKKTTLDPSLDVIDRNAHRLLELVNQLLDYRKVEQKEMPMHFGVHHVCQLVRNVCERFAPTFQQGGKTFSSDFPNEDFTAIVDAEAVTKVVSNLLSNANKYARTSVSVCCFEEPDANHFCIKVEDDGMGIAEKDRERIFQPFYQVADNKPGTGIGLSIVKNIVSQHGGQISVESEVGKGAKFVVRLPVSQSMEEKETLQNDYVPQHTDGSAVPSSSASFQKLLIVDDHQDMIDYLANHFRASYDVVTACDGIEALDRLAQNDVSLVVSDWMMPRMDGAELCRRLRRNPNTSHIPFIMLTAKTDDDSKLEGMDVGADAYVEKPFSIGYLERIIRNMFDMRRRLRERFSHEPLEPVTEIASNPTDNDFLSRMNALIEQNFANPELNVDFLAEQMAISRSGLFAKIKTLADVTPNEMIQIVRLKRAAHLLRETDQTVSDICYSVGFSSPSYFTKCFTRQFGIKPTEWRGSL